MGAPCSVHDVLCGYGVWDDWTGLDWTGLGWKRFAVVGGRGGMHGGVMVLCVSIW